MYKIKIILIGLLLLISGCNTTNDNNINNNNNLNNNLNNEYNLEDNIISEYSKTNNTYNLNDQYSVSFWIKPTSNIPSDFLFCISNTNDNKFIRLANNLVGANGTTGINLWINADNEEWITTDKYYSLNANKYNHIALTKNTNNEYIIYLNGLEAVKHKAINNIEFDANSILSIGIDPIFNYHHNEGEYKEFNVYDHVLNIDEITNIYNELYPIHLLDDITFTNMDDRINDIVLHPQVDATYPATWTTSNKNVIDIINNKGIINNTLIENDTNVTLTLNTNINNKEYTKDYIFTIKPNNPNTYIIRDKQLIKNKLGHIITHNTKLDNKTNNNTLINYKVLKGNANIINNVISKTSTNDKENITLEVTLNNNDIKEIFNIDLILLDEYTGYVMSYFQGELENEHINLAYSYDGLNWIDLNNDKPIIKASIGNNRLRDPHISRDKDGNFNLVLTQGFDTDSIYHYTSEDLITFNNESLNKITYYEKGLGLTGERAWAPESYYDPNIDAYRILYSDPKVLNNGNIFEVITKDFINYSYPKTIFNPQYPVIDGTIINIDGTYNMFYKDERDGVTSIFYTETNDLDQGFETKYDDKFISQYKHIEGPFVFKSNENNKYYIYVDNYPNSKFYVGEFTKLGSNHDIKWLDESLYTLPNDKVRHGSVIPVTNNELTKLLEHYNK